ncbi:MAG TPA: 30S ribosome-binding factor RbfA [Acidimicrobiia bacterium]|jgi:ribosome-binding factor A|nr:30S ribosome-binding factor RbfA [Acidimicrobiia bacterium]
MPRNAPHRYQRTARVNEVLVEIVADELARLSDPRLEMVTLTGAEVSSDLAYATLYYSALGAGGSAQTEDEVKATASALAKAAPHLRRSLGHQVRWRNTPALTFKLDPSISAGQRIEELLRELHSNDTPGSEA